MRWWLALLIGATLVVHVASAFPEEAPPGFVWEDLKDIHARILRPEKWSVRSGVKGGPPFINARAGVGGGPPYEFSSQSFVGWGSFPEGVWFSAHPLAGANIGQSAAEYVAGLQKEFIDDSEVLTSWNKADNPCIPYSTSVVVIRGGKENAGHTFKLVALINQATKTVYFCTVKAPTSRWKDVEAIGDQMLASLQLDPKF